jgi:hypothetical protein
VEKYCRDKKVTDNNPYAHRMWIRKSTNTHLEYVTKVARTNFDVTFYVSCLFYSNLNLNVACSVMLKSNPNFSAL